MVKKALNTLITGSNGFLGQKLLALLLQENSGVITATSKGENRFPLQAGYAYQALDITNKRAVTDVLHSVKPDVVFHTAAMTSVDVCQLAPEKCQELNVAATEHIAKVCKEIGSHLIYLSTDFVFDGLAGPYKEDDPPNPISVYGISKMRSEQAVAQLAGKWSIVRTILVYGNPGNQSRSTIVSWVRDNLQQGKRIQVVNDQLRMPTLVEDLAEACWSIAKDGHTGIYHISGPDLISIAQLAKQVAAYFSLDGALIEEISGDALPNAHLRPRSTGFDLSKARNTFNYKPRTLFEGLELINKK